LCDFGLPFFMAGCFLSSICRFSSMNRMTGDANKLAVFERRASCARQSCEST
jgi:hypothetical protein